MRASTEIVIEAHTAARRYWFDLWSYRELMYFLTWRDILVRYKQTVFGIGWALLRPLLTTLVFVFVFGRLAGLPSEGVPYPLLVICGLLPWQLFSTALGEASNSLIGNPNLVTKVYFPRLIIPISSMLVALVDFLVSLLILCALMVYYGVWPTWRILATPVLIMLTMLAAAGPGIGMAAMNVRYRDFRYIIPFLVQMGLYISPVGFSSSIVPEKYRWLYALNPMATLIDGFRWSLLGDLSVAFDGVAWVISLSVIAAGLGLGICLFRVTEQSLADRI